MISGPVRMAVLIGLHRCFMPLICAIVGAYLTPVDTESFSKLMNLSPMYIEYMDLIHLF